MMHTDTLETLIRPDDCGQSVIARLVATLEEFGYKSFANADLLLGLVRDEGVTVEGQLGLAVMLDVESHAAAAEEFKILFGLFLAENINCHLAVAPNVTLRVSLEGVTLDLVPAYGPPAAYSVYPYAAGDLRTSDILPLGVCHFSKLPVPAMPERLLEMNYGPNWRVPNPDFRFPLDAQVDQFQRLYAEMAKDA